MTHLGSIVEIIKKSKNLKKAIIVGSGAVGKTSLVRLLSKNITLDQASHGSTYKKTFFVNFDTINLVDKNKERLGHIQVLDIAGQLNQPIHALKDFIAQTLGSTDLIFLVFAGDNLQSFLDLELWINHIDNGLKLLNKQTNPNFILIKNKTDLNNLISNELVDKLINYDKRIKKYFEVSCLDGQGIDSLKIFLEDVFT